MATTFKRTISVTVTPIGGIPEGGTATVVTGDAAHGLMLAYLRGDHRYLYIAEDGTRTAVNLESCICALTEEFGEGEAYVKPDCTPLFCPEEEEPVEP